jgi:hypothetical protein
MDQAKALKNKIVGQAEQFAGELLGDQKLHDEGKARERAASRDGDEPKDIKPFGYLDQLT